MSETLLIDRNTMVTGQLIDHSDSARPTVPPEVIPILHNEDFGRLDADRIACYFSMPLTAVAFALGKKVAAVHKTPDAVSLQTGLKTWHRIAAGLSALTASPAIARAWLNTPNRDLDDETPLSFMKRGEADIIAELVEDMLVGQPR